jgi:ribosomal subunit interface protein
MQVPLQITIRDFQRSEALEGRIREKANKLEEVHPRITSCRVTVEESRKHRRQGRQFLVRVDVRVPRREIVANSDPYEDVYAALREAFDAAKRQLEELERERRGDVKAHEPTQRGKVRRLLIEEGYGFIETADGRELYFSRENVVHPAFEELSPGLPVQFIEEMADEGMQAKRVSAGKHRTP